MGGVIYLDISLEKVEKFMKKIIGISVLILAVSLMSFSGFKLWNIYSEYAAGDELYDDYVNSFFHDNLDFEEVERVEEAEEVEKKTLNFAINFDDLFEENKDIVGWIYSENTPINYPIVQSSDNDYYLRRLLDGSGNIAGSIFMDYRNSADLTDLNTLIYGHNMKNDTMFGSLKKYRHQEYYDKHPNMYLSTPEGDFYIELIAGYETDIFSNIYILPETKEELDVLYEEIIERSTFETKASFQEGDRLITFSTCSNGPDTSRYVLVGKIINIS